jgi:hypothetical protein
MKQTAFELFDEQLQEYIIAQDVVARKLIIEISFEEYMELKKQAKAMEKEQIMMAFNDGKVNSVLNKRNSEQYYKKTYLNDTGSR